jgi:hypothetical protein
LGEVVFGTPDITVVNNPPVVVNQSSSTAHNTATSPINLLAGSSDPESNIDPPTIFLVDPNDATNFGEPGRPLTILGEGTYVVDNTGNVIFTPVTGFFGDAIVDFRVEDVTGATSNTGLLTIAVQAASSCNDVVPPGCPTAPLVAADVTFDITNLNDEATSNASSKILDLILLMGQLYLIRP